MKRLFLIGLFLVTILALGVCAADLTLSTTSLSVSAIKPTRSFSTTFTVSNATNNLTGLTLSRTGLDNFNISFSIAGVPGSSFNLNTNEAKTITVNGKIPDNVNTRLSPFSGAIIISGGEIPIPTKTVSLSINAESQLRLDNVKFVVDGTSKSIDNGDTRKDVKPGSKLEIKGDVENTFTDDDDIVIEDVTVEITINGIESEGDDDLEGDDDVGDIDADDKESFKVDFEISDDVDADEYKVNILVEGEDENGAKHYVEWKDVKVKVEKDKHDIWITKAAVTPAKVSCTRNVNVNVQLKNQGTSDEDEVVLQIESSDLGISLEDTNIDELSEGTGEDTELSESYQLKIDTKIKPGTYPITIKAYYDTDTLSDTEKADLIVEECQPVAAEEEKKGEEVVVVTTPPKTTEEKTPSGEEPEVITTPYTETTETSFLSSNMYVILLIGAIAIAVIIIVIMIVVLFTMKRRERE